MNMNKVFVAGNLTRDPELKALPSGTNVVNFSIASNRDVKKDEKWEKVADYHNIVVFGKRAEAVQRFFKKGSPIFVEGRMQTQSWDDKETGKKMYRTEVVAEDFKFVGRKDDNQSGGAPASTSSAPTPPTTDMMPDYPEEEINPEDIPF